MKIREDRWWNIFAIFCLLAAMLMTAYRLDSTHWTEDLYVLKWLTLIGYILGLGFGYSYFSSFAQRIMMILYSLIIIPWSFAITYDSGIPWLERITNLINRFGINLNNLFNNTPIQDPILFTAFLATVIWFTALFAGYLMTRTGKPWIPLVVSAITIFSSEFYYLQSKNLYTSFFVIFSLMVISICNFMKSSQKWQQKGTLVEYETTLTIGRTALIISIILVLLAWNFSGIVSAFNSPVTKGKVTGIFENLRTQFSRITAPLKGPLYIQQDFYGDSIGLGTGAVLGDDLVFEVKVNDSRPIGTRYYWRARTYDTYQDNLWKSTFREIEKYQLDAENLVYPDIIGYPSRSFSFKSNINLGLLYTPPYPAQINQNVNVLAEKLPTGAIDLSALTLQQTLFAGESYSIDSFVPTPSIKAMKTASTQYPSWVTENYLQLPDNFSKKISDLAQEITANETNNYDKVNAITLYLRNNITYQEQIPSPPQNSDPLEWFLFDLKKGFCNYYASSEVLMARSLGIPARMVFGYAQGDSDKEGLNFQVVRKQSHAWPEVYFPGLGWVEFEPTASQPVLTRNSGESSQTSLADLTGDEFDRSLTDNPLTHEPLDAVSDIDVPLEPVARFKLIYLLPYLWLLAVVDMVALYIIRRRRIGIAATPAMMLESFLKQRGWRIPHWVEFWVYFTNLSSPQKSFFSIVFSSRLLGARLEQCMTPREIIAIFCEILPSQFDNAKTLLSEYHKALYSDQQSDIHLMQSLSKQIIWAALRKKIRLLFHPEEKLAQPSLLH